MKIYGPYTRKDGRKHIIKVYDDGTRRTQSYPRYLMEEHLGRELLKEETIDHIDNDFTNDSINNLQIMSLQDNAKKANKDNDIKPAYVKFDCPCCGKKTTKRKKDVDHNRRLGKSGPFCSRSCAGRATYTNPWT